MGLFSEDKKEKAVLKTDKLLKKIAKKQNFVSMSGLTLTIKDETFDVDNILLTKAGAVVCLTYGTAGDLFYNGDKSEWTHISKKNAKTYVESPVLKAEKAADLVKKIFIKENIYRTDVLPLAVFTKSSNRALCIYAPEKMNFIKLSKLKKKLKNKIYLKDNGVIPDKMCEALNKYKSK